MTTVSEAAPEQQPEIDVANAHRLYHPWRWVISLVLLVFLVGLGYFIVTNDKFEWPVVARYFNAQIIGQGLFVTLELTVIAMAIGIVGGVLIAVGRLSENPLARAVCSGYVWFFRGIPVLVQLIFWYNLSVLLPHISLGFAVFDTNTLISPLTAAILGLGLNEIAYMAEIIRGGLLAVDHGQTEAALALGMGRVRVFRRIVLPQAMRFIMPPTGSQVINMVKATSLVSVIALSDLLYTVQTVYNRTFETIPLLIVACIWYLIITTVLYIAQSFIERHYARGSYRGPQQSFWSFVFFRRPKRTVEEAIQ